MTTRLHIFRCYGPFGPAGLVVTVSAKDRDEAYQIAAWALNCEPDDVIARYVKTIC